MNETFTVASIFDCDYDLDAIEHAYKPDPIWRTTIIGCRILKILQEIYSFNFTYEHIQSTPWSADGKRFTSSIAVSTDLYASPLALTADALQDSYPIIDTIKRRFGFVLRRLDNRAFMKIFSQPFSRPVWNWLYAFAIIVTLVFYLMRWWERRLLGVKGQCSLSYELLVVIAAYCQHILPDHPALVSRRIAYFTFLMCSYVVYSSYTSNLLSHLVSDRDKTMTIEELANSDYECVFLENMRVNLSATTNDHNMNILKQKLKKAKYMNQSSGLEAVKSARVAILSDYVTLYPLMRRKFYDHEVCNLVKIDVHTNIKHYLFTRKDFKFKEQFKIGALRVKETGILQRLMSNPEYTPPRCTAPVLPAHRTSLMHIMYPLNILAWTCVLSWMILAAERVHYQRNRLWPYVN